MIYLIGNAYLRVGAALIMAAWLLFYSLAAAYGAEKYGLNCDDREIGRLGDDLLLLRLRDR